MRQIKFRGRTADGQFVYGDLSVTLCNPPAIVNKSGIFSVTDVAQFVDFDGDGREVYEGDTLVGEDGLRWTAHIAPAVLSEAGFIHDIDLECFKLEVAS